MSAQQPPRPDDIETLPETMPSCGDFDIRIARDGSWHYRGSPIRRLALCRLFASVLRREADGTFWLVTPVERGRVVVDDAPFLAVALEERDGPDGRILAFRTSLEDWVEADGDHPIRVVVDPASGEPSPYVLVRPGLEARLSRAVFYQLVGLAQLRDARLVVDSAGVIFELGEV